MQHYAAVLLLAAAEALSTSTAPRAISGAWPQAFPAKDLCSNCGLCKTDVGIASVTDAIPTSVLHKPQLLHRSLAGKACGQAPVMARGAVLVERASAAARSRAAAAACGIAANGCGSFSTDKRAV